MHVIDKQHVVSFVIVPNHFVSHFAVKLWFSYSNKLYLQISQTCDCINCTVNFPQLEKLSAICSLYQSDYDRSNFLLLRISDTITCFYVSKSHWNMSLSVVRSVCPAWKGISNLRTMSERGCQANSFLSANRHSPLMHLFACLFVLRNASECRRRHSYQAVLF